MKLSLQLSTKITANRSQSTGKDWDQLIIWQQSTGMVQSIFSADCSNSKIKQYNSKTYHHEKLHLSSDKRGPFFL